MNAYTTPDEAEQMAQKWIQKIQNGHRPGDVDAMADDIRGLASREASNAFKRGYARGESDGRDAKAIDKELQSDDNQITEHDFGGGDTL